MSQLYFGPIWSSGPSFRFSLWKCFTCLIAYPLSPDALTGK